ncbi:MAG: GNAT family N-acetyltransferase [Paracoccaceae bacterium]
MDTRIDPPSSMHRLTAADLERQSEQDEIWAIGTPPIACVILTRKLQALYVGKLAVAASHRGQGLARRLIMAAETRARALGLPALELQVRVELIENQAAFSALGFRKIAETAHPGFTRPTSYTYQKLL